MRLTQQKLILITGACLLLSACESTNSGEAGGTLIGSASGALLGAQIGAGTGQIAGAALGALIGGFAGNQVGQSIDKTRTPPPVTPVRQYNGTETDIALTGRPDSSSLACEDNKSDKCCRGYTQTIHIDGKARKAHGKACLQNDGSWRLMR